MNKNGDLIIDYQFDDAQDFMHGRAIVEIDGKVQKINIMESDSVCAHIPEAFLVNLIKVEKHCSKIIFMALLYCIYLI